MSYLVVVQVRVEADLVSKWEQAALHRYGSAKMGKSRIVNDALRAYLDVVIAEPAIAKKEENRELTQLLNMIGIKLPERSDEAAKDNVVLVSLETNQNPTETENK